MSIASEIARLQQAKADIAEAIVAKGGEVSGTLDNYASAIEALPSGGGEIVIEGEYAVVATASQSSVELYDDRITRDNFFYAEIYNEAYLTTPQANRIIYITAYNTDSELNCSSCQYTATSSTTITNNRAVYDAYNGRVQLRAPVNRVWDAGDVYKYKIILKA